MRKGVSTVIATILMLIITIALAGMAYTYIAGMWPSVTAGIEVADAYCIEGGRAAGTGECPAGNPCDQAIFIIRNLGGSQMTSASVVVVQTAPSTDALVTDGAWNGVTIDSGVTVSYTNTCLGNGGRNCYYRITPPQGKTVQASVYCT